MVRDGLELPPTLANGPCEALFFVAFCDAERPYWWMRYFLKPGFTHCMVLMPSVQQVEAPDGTRFDVQRCVGIEFNGYAIIQHLYHWIKNPLEDLPAVDVARLWAKKGWRVVALAKRMNGEKALPWWGTPLLTCVSVAKGLMGVHAYAQTPHQLYRWMLRNGGLELTGGIEDERWESP